MTDQPAPAPASSDAIAQLRSRLQTAIRLLDGLPMRFAATAESIAQTCRDAASALEAQDAVKEKVGPALTALETAAWSRSWSKLKLAREELRTILGVEVVGHLRKALNEMIERCSCSDPIPDDKRMCKACGRRFVRERGDDRIR